MNKVNLTGRLTDNIDIKVTQNNKKVTRFSLAVRKNTKDQEGNYQTNFINVQCWEQRAEYLSTYATKGTLIGVSGSIETDSFINKDGKKVYDTYILANEVEVLSKPQKTENTEYTILNGVNKVEVDPDELPFY